MPDAALPPNSIGRMLINDAILARAIEHITEIVNEAEEVENSLFSLPLRFQNLNWDQFCSINSDLRIANTNFDKPVCEDQVVLYENMSVNENTRIIISHPDHQIPNIEDADISTIHTCTDKQVNQKGFILEQVKGNMGIIAYIPFLPGKKIIGLFTKEGGIVQFYYTGIFKTDTIIPNISVGELAPRRVATVLNDYDKVLIANSSPRLRNQVTSWYYLKEALRYLNNLLFQTIDPSYINKIMTLNKALSYQPTSEE